MIGILIVAHAPLASALKSVAQHTFPDCAVTVETLDVSPQASVEQMESLGRELLARIKNLLRRTASMRRLGRRVYQFDGFTFDSTARQLRDTAGQAIALTRAEFELLRQLVAHPGEVLSRDRLSQGVTHRGEDGSGRTIDVLIRRLRAKLGDDPRAPRIISTSHGEGYVFTAQLD